MITEVGHGPIMEDFPTGVNKEVLFPFHATLLAVQAYASCFHFNSVPLHNLTLVCFCLPTIVSFLSLQRWKVKVWTLCQLMHFLPQWRQPRTRFYFRLCLS